MELKQALLEIKYLPTLIEYGIKRAKDMSIEELPNIKIYSDTLKILKLQHTNSQHYLSEHTIIEPKPKNEKFT